MPLQRTNTGDGGGRRASESPEGAYEVVYGPITSLNSEYRPDEGIYNIMGDASDEVKMYVPPPTHARVR